MEEAGLIKPEDLVDLDELYSCFSSQEEEVFEDDRSQEDTKTSEA